MTREVEIGDTGTESKDKLNAAMNNDIFGALKADADTPIYIVAGGQSNMWGSAVSTTAMVTNPNVYDYQDSNAAPGVYSFVVADPNRTDWTYTESAQLGMRGGGFGNIAWACADMLQKVTGRDVYIYLNVQPGAPMANWTTGGSVSDLNDVHGPLAAAVMAPLGVDQPDILLWCQGEWETILNKMASSTYALGWHNDVMPNFETQGLVEEGKTHIQFIDLGEYWPKYEYARYCADMMEVSTNVDTSAHPQDGTGHWIGDDPNLIGQRCAGKAITRGTGTSRSVGKALESIIQQQGSVVSNASMPLEGLEGGGMDSHTLRVSVINDDRSKWYEGEFVYRFVTDSGGVVDNSMDVLWEYGTEATPTIVFAPFGNIFSTVNLQMNAVGAETWSISAVTKKMYISDISGLT